MYIIHVLKHTTPVCKMYKLIKKNDFCMISIIKLWDGEFTIYVPVLIQYIGMHRIWTRVSKTLPTCYKLQT
jgi:hypothetical protein